MGNKCNDRGLPDLELLVDVDTAHAPDALVYCGP